MKKYLFILLILLSVSTFAQSKTPEGVKQTTTVNVSSSKKTGQIITKSGKDYPVWESARGSFYIVRVSGNTGNEYKQYLKKEDLQ